MSICAFNSLPKSEYSNLFIVTGFSSTFSGKSSLPVKNSYLPKFPNDKTKILAVYLPKSC